MREKLARRIASAAIASFILAAGLVAPGRAQLNKIGTNLDPQNFGQIERGRYLAIVGDCASCHNAPGSGQPYAGGWPIETPFGAVVGANITPDPNTGIGGWSVPDIAAYLKGGHNAVTASTGIMGEEIALSSSQMTDADLTAIATYLKDLPGQTSSPSAAVSASDPRMIAGGAIYADACSACHGMDGKGVPFLFPSLARSPNVRSTDPASLIRVLIEGARSVGTHGEPTAPGMPSFGWKLSDDQAAAVLTYIRNSWGAAAPAVDPHEVEQALARAAIAAMGR